MIEFGSHEGTGRARGGDRVDGTAFHQEDKGGFGWGGGENEHEKSSFKHADLEVPCGDVWVNHESSAQKPGLV